MAIPTGEITVHTSPSKRQQIIDSIISQINAGELRPKQPLPTATELRKEFKCSITPVREAINELKAFGYVVGVPGVRVFVAEHPPGPTE